MFLFLDASYEYCNIALFIENKIIASLSIKTCNNLTDIIVEHINKLLTKHKIIPNNIERLYIVNGPGSFTGIKAINMIAKAWHAVFKIDIFYISSLHINLSTKYGVSILKAGNNKYYVGNFTNIQSTNKIYDVVFTEADLKKHKFIKNKVITSELNQTNIFKNLLVHLNDFKIAKNIDKLTPLYIKKPA